MLSVYTRSFTITTKYEVIWGMEKFVEEKIKSFRGLMEKQTIGEGYLPTQEEKIWLIKEYGKSALQFIGANRQ